jgi:hypothetical protein
MTGRQDTGHGGPDMDVFVGFFWGKLLIGTISRKTSDSTDKCNGQNLLDIAVTNALELLRGQNFEN